MENLYKQLRTCRKIIYELSAGIGLLFLSSSLVKTKASKKQTNGNISYILLQFFSGGLGKTIITTYPICHL
jgi:hypothetical protein